MPEPLELYFMALTEKTNTRACQQKKSGRRIEERKTTEVKTLNYCNDNMNHY